MTLPPKNSTWCSMAWNHQFIDPTGRVKPCCRFVETYRPPEHNLKQQTLENIFFGEWMGDIRSKMLAGEKVNGCMRCYEEQAAGKKSLRERYNERADFQSMVNIDNPQIRWLELAISNECNLACRMCDSRYSWRWYDQEKELYGKTYNSEKRAIIDINNLKPFYPYITHLKFTGGEPLVTPEHMTILEELVRHGNSSNIFLNYSTNCTIKPRPELVSLWKRFKFVEFALSFDAASAGEAEYIRWPAKYERIEQTTKSLLSLHKEINVVCALRSTVSLLNIHVMPETIEWWLTACQDHYRTANIDDLTLNPTHLTFPRILSPQVLPPHLKQKVAAKLESFKACASHRKVKNIYDYLIKHMYASDQSFLLPQLESYVSGTDKLRGQNFATTYPYYEGIFDSLVSTGKDLQLTV